MPDYLPKYYQGQPLTVTALSDVTGGRLVAIAGPLLVAHTSADSPSCLGVAAFDAAAGERVTVYPRPGGVHRLVAAGAITAGARVVSAADGKAQTVGSPLNPIGVALSAAANAGAIVEVLL